MTGVSINGLLEKQEVNITVEYDGRRYEFVGDAYEPGDFELNLERCVEHVPITEGVMLPALTGPTELKISARLHQGSRERLGTFTLLDYVDPPAVEEPPPPPLEPDLLKTVWETYDALLPKLDVLVEQAQQLVDEVDALRGSIIEGAGEREEEQS